MQAKVCPTCNTRSYSAGAKPWLCPRCRRNLDQIDPRDDDESICWDCANATVDRCPWVDHGEKIWTTAIPKRVRYNANGKSERAKVRVEELYLVQSCPFYQIESRVLVCKKEAD